jgi:hypothetical protein
MFLKGSLLEVRIMRTKMKQTGRVIAMFTELKTLTTTASRNFIQDMVGATALIVMLVSALHLPSFL